MGTLVNLSKVHMKKFAVIFALSLFVFSCTSKGEKIEDYSNPQKALLVLDMQIDFVGENAKMPIEKNQVNRLIATINNIIDEYSRAGYKIIYIKNIFRKNDIANFFRNKAAVEGTPGIEIDPRIKIVSDIFFDKNQPDAFSNSDFEKYLIQNKINELYICGVMADQCVYYTSMAALNRNYKVNYIINAVGSTNMNKIKKAAEKLNKKGINIIE